MQNKIIDQPDGTIKKKGCMRDKSARYLACDQRIIENSATNSGITMSVAVLP